MKKIIVFLLMVSIGVGFASAQKATPYQKKKVEIIKKYLQPSPECLKRAKEICLKKGYPADSYQQYEEIIHTYCYSSYDRALRSGLLDNRKRQSFANELNAIKKLKNSTDRRMELQISESPMGKINKKIGQYFFDWQQKGEFEKTEEYSARIKEKSQSVFTVICRSVISEAINEIKIDYHLGNYYPDSECFEIEVNLKGWKWNSTIPMIMQKAKPFKEKLQKVEVDHYGCFTNKENCCVFFMVLPKNCDNFQCVDYHIYPKEVVYYDYDFDEIFDSNVRIINGHYIYKYEDSISEKISVEKHYRSYDYDFDFSKKIGLDYYAYGSFHDFRKQGYRYYYDKRKIPPFFNDTCLIYNKVNDYDEGKALCGENAAYTDIERFNIKYGENKKKYIIPCCVSKNANSNMVIEDVIVYFDDLDIDNPYLKGCAFNYTKQKFITASGIESDVSGALSGITSPENAISSLSQAIYTYKTHVLQYGYDTSDYKLELAIPNEVKDNPQKIMDVANSLLDSVRIREGELLELHIADSTMFSKYSDSLQQAVNQAKTELSEFPYNINKLTLEGDYTLSRSNYGNETALKEELRNKTTEIQEKTVALKSLIVKELRTNSPEKYLQIWFKQNPGKRAEAEKLWPECRCKYAGEQDFQLAFTDDTVSDCGCRADLYDKYGNLFKNKHEFDKYYDKGQLEINHEIEERTAVKKELLAFETYMKTAKQVKLKEALTSKKDAVQLVVSKLQYFKNNYFYEEAVQILFTYNEKLAKEWKENGQYFESQVEMYEAYIGEEYKAILKGKKQ